jgi:hypothetical protein
LGDNLGVTLAFARSRSKNFAVFVLIRKTAAYQLAGDFEVSYRWIPSELNFSDFGTRVYDDVADSKNLLWALANPSSSDVDAVGASEFSQTAHGILTDDPVLTLKFSAFFFLNMMHIQIRI